ncbi:helix-turn-helix domain-containing protein [Phenylobacterium sp.]|uniref:helix-turn-helix domain-containing protein n=1 Tax=Phenylobacterium sp. TaxID=1871053 RepID=UPI002FCC6752
MSAEPFFDLAPPPRLTMRTIAFRVAEKHGLTLDDLRSPSRRRPLVVARQEAMHEIRQATTQSLPAIGRFFDRDHTTVIHALERHAARLQA